MSVCVFTCLYACTCAEPLLLMVFTPANGSNLVPQIKDKTSSLGYMWDRCYGNAGLGSDAWASPHNLWRCHASAVPTTPTLSAHVNVNRRGVDFKERSFNVA